MSEIDDDMTEGEFEEADITEDADLDDEGEDLDMENGYFFAEVRE